MLEQESLNIWEYGPLGKEALSVLNFSQTLFKTILSKQFCWIKFWKYSYFWYNIFTANFLTQISDIFFLFFIANIQSKNYCTIYIHVNIYISIHKDKIESPDDYICIGLSKLNWLIRMNFKIGSNYNLLSISCHPGSKHCLLNGFLNYQL